MVAYNFQDRFIEPIRAGSKIHTIRRHGKRKHAEPGDRLQLYSGMRTRKCKKIIPDTLCTRVDAIAIRVGPMCIEQIWINGKDFPRGNWKLFLLRDGFTRREDFYETFKAMHGEGIFHGILIHWAKCLTYTHYEMQK